MIQAKQPAALDLSFKRIHLKNFKLDYRNDVSATYALLDLGALDVKPRRIDLDNRVLELDNVSLENAKSTIRLGKKEAARVVAKEVKQEVKAQSEARWAINVTSVNFNNNITSVFSYCTKNICFLSNAYRTF